MKKKVLFIVKKFIIEPLGVMHLSSIAKKCGYETKFAFVEDILDFDTYQGQDYDIFCFSILTGSENDFIKAAAIIDQHREKSKKAISIAGGPHATFFAESLEPFFDFVVKGEAEIFFEKLLKGNVKKKGIHLGKLPVELDKLPFADKELFHMVTKDNPIKHLITRRGCPFNCTYCFNESFKKLYGKEWKLRKRSVDNVIQELKEWKKDPVMQFVYFQDDDFVDSKKWMEEFAEKYKKEIGLPFHCHVRSEHVTETTAKLLGEAGCLSAHLAIECGDEDYRKKFLHRYYTNEQVIKSIRLLKNNGIMVMTQNMLGLPFSDWKTDLKTLMINKKAKPHYAWCSIFQPYPNTHLGKMVGCEGFSFESNFFDKSPLGKKFPEYLQKCFALIVKSHLFWTLLPFKSQKVYKWYRNLKDKAMYANLI